MATWRSIDSVKKTGGIRRKRAAERPKRAMPKSIRAARSETVEPILFLLAEAARRNFSSRPRQEAAAASAFRALIGYDLTREDRRTIGKEFEK
jgi:hypothetical protein